MKHSFSNEQQVLLNILSKKVFSGGADLSDISFDSKELFREASFQAVIPLAFEGCIEYGLKTEDGVFLEYFTKCGKIAAKNQSLLQIQDKCKIALEKRGIEFAVIKGAAVSSLYKNPELRSMGDVDILVSKKDFDRAAKALIEEGFVYKGGEGQVHREFTFGGCVLELHFEINGIPEGAKGNEIRKALENGIFGEMGSFDGYSFPMPKPHIHGLVLLLHMYEHLQSGGIGLRHLCDWGVFAAKYLEGGKECQEILDFYKSLSVYKFCCVVTKTAQRYFVMNQVFDWCPPVDPNITEQLMHDILDGGNFGYKKPEERYISDILVKRDDEGKKSTISRSVSNFRKRVYTSMPSSKKYPVLFLVAPFYIPIRYLFRVITGKRKKINPIKMMQKSSERRSLYDQFEMFE